jgi:hypothetical protein
MSLSEFVQGFTSRPGSSMLDIQLPLADTFGCIGFRCEIK